MVRGIFHEVDKLKNGLRFVYGTDKIYDRFVDWCREKDLFEGYIWMEPFEIAADSSIKYLGGGSAYIEEALERLKNRNENRMELSNFEPEKVELKEPPAASISSSLLDDAVKYIDELNVVRNILYGKSIFIEDIWGQED